MRFVRGMLPGIHELRRFDSSILAQSSWGMPIGFAVLTLSMTGILLQKVRAGAGWPDFGAAHPAAGPRRNFNRGLTPV
jgi:hypothetical protein